MNDEAGMEIERMLEPLIREHGLERVRADLAVLMPGTKWQDWQRVDNLAANIASRLQREHQPHAL